MSETVIKTATEDAALAQYTDFAAGQTTLVAEIQDRTSAKQDITAAILNNRPDFAFSLRGMALNRIVDCASPLLTLMMRIPTLSEYADKDIKDLHKRCSHEIETIELELHKAGYDRVTILAFRYCLCSVVDEAALKAPWGMDSIWSNNSLLATYHHETWGGEKFFVITDRLMDEPQRYIDILEFLYLCMVLGYEGKHHSAHNGTLNLEAFMKEVHDVIRKERGYPETLGTFAAKNIVAKEHHVTWQTPVVAVILGALAVALALYIGYFLYTESYTGGIIETLRDVLGQAK